MIFGLFKTKKDREIEVLKRALWLFRGIIAEVKFAKGGNAIIAKKNYNFLIQALIETRDINCLPKGRKAKDQGRKRSQ